MRNRQSGLTLIQFLALCSIPAVFAIAVEIGCCGGRVKDENDAIRAVESQGYQVIDVTNSYRIAPRWYDCDADDNAGYEVRALNRYGKEVNAIVCCGYYANCRVVRSR